MSNTTTIKTYIQVRRGLSSEWESINPVLRAGEPGLAIDTLVLKFGDGVRPWNELPTPTSTEGTIIDAETHYDFPSIGSKTNLYKANKEGILYQWNEVTLTYEALNTIDAVTIINGGNANGIKTT